MGSRYIIKAKRWKGKHVKHDYLHRALEHGRRSPARKNVIENERFSHVHPLHVCATLTDRNSTPSILLLLFATILFTRQKTFLVGYGVVLAETIHHIGLSLRPFVHHESGEMSFHQGCSLRPFSGTFSESEPRSLSDESAPRWNLTRRVVIVCMFQPRAEQLIIQCQRQSSAHTTPQHLQHVSPHLYCTGQTDLG